MKRAAFLAALAAAMLLFTAPGSAVTLNCGDTITADTSLDADVVCTEPSAVGVHINADNITLQMNGHAIRATGGDGVTGIDSAGAVQGVEIRNGTIEGFDSGVSMTAANTSLLKLNIRARVLGVSLDGTNATAFGPTLCEPNFPANNCVYRSVIEVPSLEFFTEGIGLSGDNNHVWGNTIRGAPTFAIYSAGDKARAILNTVEDCSQIGIFLEGHSTYALAWGNSVTGCEERGIQLGSSAGVSARARNNVVTGSGEGIGVDGIGGLVEDNDASGNLNTGIRVIATGALIRNNTANNNGQYGFIVLDAGNTDGGGNHASGNGAADCTGDLTFCAGVTP